MKLVGVQKTSLVSKHLPMKGNHGQPVISRTWMPWMFASPVLNGLQGCWWLCCRQGWHGSPALGVDRVIRFFFRWRESQFWGRNSWTSLFFGWWNEFWEDLTRCFCVSKGWTWSHEWQHLQLLPRNVECVEKWFSAVAAQGIEESRYYCTKSDNFSSKSWKFGESCQFHLKPVFMTWWYLPPEHWWPMNGYWRSCLFKKRWRCEHI